VIIFTFWRLSSLFCRFGLVAFFDFFEIENEKLQLFELEDVEHVPLLQFGLHLFPLFVPEC